MTTIRNNRSCKISVFKNLDQYCFINLIKDTFIGLYEAMIFMIKNFLHMNSLCRGFNSQLIFTCSNSTMKILEKGVKYVENQQ